MELWIVEQATAALWRSRLRSKDSSVLLVLAVSAAFLTRLAHDPARKAGETVQAIDLADPPDGD